MARHEKVNKRLKDFAVMKDFRHRSDEKHRIIFLALINIIQITLIHDPLEDVDNI
jgi:hypothetical protein